LPLAFAPVGWFPLALIAPALLFALWLEVPPPRAFRRGWLFGAGLFGVGVSWIYVSISQYGGVSLLSSLSLTALFVALMALYPALLGYLVARLYPGRGAGKALLILPAAWTLFEWLRGWLFTGFPWLDLGYSQIDTPLSGLAPWLGVYGVSWATAASAALLLEALRLRRPYRVAARLAVGGAAFAALWGGAWLLGRVEWTHPASAPIRVSLVQGDIAQRLKWRPEERQATMDRYARLTAGHWDSRLIVWPETAVPLFYHQVADTFMAALERDARAHGADLLVGVPVLDEATESYYNSLVKLGAQVGASAGGGTRPGDSPSFYHKRHLVPFTEYLPLKQVLGGVVELLDVPMSDFSPGPARQPPLQVAGTRAGASICYEIAFGDEVIRALPDAELLVNVSNDAWFGHSLAPYQHLQIARMRALETGRPLLRATNTGITAIVDHRGKVTAALPQFEADVLTATVQPRGGATPYVRLGNLPVVLAVALILGTGLLRRRSG
jgi:apolipoprotein N-acyltransferase